MKKQLPEEDLDLIAQACTGKTFDAFVAFAMEAQARDGYVPAPVPSGVEKVHHRAAAFFADALEARGLRVSRAALSGKGQA